MHRILILSFFLVVGTPVAAQEWRQAAEYDILLSSYDIAPQTIYLKEGEPVRLRFVNNSERVHDFSAYTFFAAAQMRRRDARLLAGGRLILRPGQTLTIALVPKAGRYRMKSNNFVHRLLGMNGIIIVE